MSFLQEQSLLHLPSSVGVFGGTTQRHHHSASKDGSPTGGATTSKSQVSVLNPLLNFVKNPSDTIRNFTIDEAGKQRLVLQARLKNARTHLEWIEAATALDELDGNNTWKAEPESSEYDASQIRARLEQLEEARISGDIGRMLFLIRTTLTRHLGGMGNVELYRHSYTGTKYLIESYISTTLATLEALITAPPSSDPQLSPKKILESLVATRQSFGRTALLLSGGATFGMNHSGVLKALWEADLLPRIISGASAGAIVASVLCVRTDDEIPHMIQEFPYGPLDVFHHKEEPEGLFAKLGRLIKIGAWVDISHLTRVMRALLGDMTFQEAYNRTRRILNICVSPANVYELPQLLNYVTAPNVLIWSAVAASCSLPLLFTSASLLAKNPKTGLAEPWNASPQKWIDGSVNNDLPMTRLAEMFNVNHFIVSQVNPHVVPFLEKEPAQPVREESLVGGRNSFEAWKSTLVSLAMDEALHRVNVLAEMGIFTTSLTKARSILSQKYAGDITIFPEVPLVDLQKLIKNPTPEFMIEASLRGERATWPRLSRVRNCCAIELALDRCIHKLRTKVVFSGSQVDLRLNTLDFNKKPEKQSAANTYGTRSRASNISKKRPVSGDPNEMSLYAPPGLPVASFETQQANRLSYPPATTTRGRSHSTGPPQLPPFSPALTRTLGMGKGYFEPGTTRPPGSPNSNRSIHSMNTGKSVAIKSPLPSSASTSSSNRSSANIGSPSSARLVTGEEAHGHPLRRTGSRYRLVRQTPSAELDPADAEDESAAIAGSSEDEDPFQLPASLDDHERDLDHDSDEDVEMGGLTGQQASAAGGALHENPLSLQRRPYLSRSTTALSFYGGSTYLPNDEAYSSRASLVGDSFSVPPSPVYGRGSLTMAFGRYGDATENSEE